MPHKVFISYRREDSRYQARRIYDAFVKALPTDTVFMDVDSMAPGDDFVEILEGWVQQCEVLLALIGPRWIDSIDPRTNLRRLDNPDDFVRIEVRGALARKIPVVPVLLDAAGMPTAAELPDDVKALTRRNAEFVDFRTFDADVQRLIKRLKLGKEVEQLSEAPGPEATGNANRPTGVAMTDTFAERIKPNAAAAKPLVWVAAAVLALAAVAVTFVMVNRSLNPSYGMIDFIRSEERQADEVRARKASGLLALAENARDEAEAKAADAAAALTKTEENRRAAEARANDAADALKKSDKARQDAESRATSAAAAQAKAEDAQRAADKARITAEGAASGAAFARSQADSSRQLAEVRANDAAEALRKSEAARREAEAKLAALSPAPRQTSGSPLSSGHLLTVIGSKSRWAKWSGLYCTRTKDPNFLSLEVGNDSITWVDGLGRMETEKILFSYENEFHTSASVYSRDPNSSSAQLTRLVVQPSNRDNFNLERCP
jgi:hypothetical protein